MGTDAGLPQGNKDLGMWERRWTPYDEATYQVALALVDPADVIVDIGAGDLRLARRAADIASKVYALELDETVLEKGVAAGPLPDNLVILRGDARYLSFPSGVTCGILLMRHCLHFQSYASKLRDVGAKRLITNARWGFGVELVALQATRRQYHQLKLGWYACWCGAVGFKPGEVKKLTPEVDATIFEVVDCPECKVQ